MGLKKWGDCLVDKVKGVRNCGFHFEGDGVGEVWDIIGVEGIGKVCDRGLEFVEECLKGLGPGRVFFMGVV